jgi:uncharacterized protein (TIGR02265 family)
MTTPKPEGERPREGAASPTRKAEEPLAFASMVEGMRRALGDRVTEAAHRRFETIGIPMRGPLKPTYPRTIWIEASLYAGQLLSPELNPEQQRVALGKRFVRGYMETIVGRALITAMRLLGPRRSMLRMQRSFNTGNNYSKVVIREVPGALEVDVFGAPYPEWYEGMIHESLIATGAKEAEVKAIRYEPPEITTYRAVFKE